MADKQTLSIGGRRYGKTFMSYLCELEQGKALIIVGPEGTGKTVLARAIASQYGEFRETTYDRLREPFTFSNLLCHTIKTLIVDGFPNIIDEVATLKRIVTADKLTCDSLGEKSTICKTPKFIFCTGNVDGINLLINDRRFTVISLNKQVTKCQKCMTFVYAHEAHVCNL